MKSKKIKLIAIITSVVIILAGLCGWIAWGNITPQLSTYTVTSSDLPSSFSGYTIAQVSDLHNTQIGDGNEELIEMLKSARPDMIAITGDVIDSRRTDIDIALDFAKKAVKIAPCYYVTGNHEARIANHKDFEDSLVEIGVKVLNDERTELKKDGQKITLLGVDDPRVSTANENCYPGIMETKLGLLTGEEDGYTILLAHRPELFEIYEDYDIDLVLSGHAHGGQFRLPFLGGVYVPNQGFFPKYDAGLFTEDGTNMIVSRGIGNSIFPFRINNRPEIVLIELQRDVK